MLEATLRMQDEIVAEALKKGFSIDNYSDTLIFCLESLAGVDYAAIYPKSLAVRAGERMKIENAPPEHIDYSYEEPETGIFLCSWWLKDIVIENSEVHDIIQKIKKDTVMNSIISWILDHKDNESSMPKVTAIKLVRRVYSCGLKTAKEVVDEFIYC